MRYLRTIDQMPWVCGRDFNKIAALKEKFCGNGRAANLMDDFKTTLEVCKLNDLGFQGPKYAWNNGCEGGEFTKEGLDRVTATVDWCELYSNVEINMEEALSSDHCPIYMV